MGKGRKTTSRSGTAEKDGQSTVSLYCSRRFCVYCRSRYWYTWREEGERGREGGRVGGRDWGDKIETQREGEGEGGREGEERMKIEKEEGDRMRRVRVQGRSVKE